MSMRRRAIFFDPNQEAVMTQEARIRVSLSAGDLEVQGSEAFVERYGDAIQDLLVRLKDHRAPQAATQAPRGAGSKEETTAEKREFGEVLHALPNKVSGSDQMLVAGWYAQDASADSTFSTGDANQLLLGQGVKIANPSQSLKNSIAAKRVFKVGSRYRVSKTGEQHLQSLIGG
jgi:hypothetical protein